MIGASKIDIRTDDLERLQEMFDMGLNNCEIHRTYRTNKGESLSRIHISHIRRGKRWNSELRSFLMKYEMKNNNIISTTIGEDEYTTSIGFTMTYYPTTDTFTKTYFISHYKNSILVNDKMVHLLENKPTQEELIKKHNQFVFDDISHF